MTLTFACFSTAIAKVEFLAGHWASWWGLGAGGVGLSAQALDFSDAS